MPVCLVGGGSIGGCLVAHSCLCSAPLTSSVRVCCSMFEGFLKTAGHLGWKKQTNSWSHKDITIKKKLLKNKVVFNRYKCIWRCWWHDKSRHRRRLSCVGDLTLILSVWYSRSCSSLQPPQSWQCRHWQALCEVSLGRSVSRSGRWRQTSFSRMWNFGVGLFSHQLHKTREASLCCVIAIVKARRKTYSSVSYL